MVGLDALKGFARGLDTIVGVNFFFKKLKLNLDQGDYADKHWDNEMQTF